MARLLFGQQSLELLPDGLDDAWWHSAGMETLLRFGQLQQLPE